MFLFLFFFFLGGAKMELSYPLLPFLHNGTVGMVVLFFQKKS